MCLCVLGGEQLIHWLGETRKERQTRVTEREKDSLPLTGMVETLGRGGVYMRIGDRETAVRTLAWANTVGYDKDVLMPWQPVQIK